MSIKPQGDRVEKGTAKWTFLQRIRYSIIPPDNPATKKHGRRRYFRNFLFHFRPRGVPARTLRFNLTWGLGGTAVVLVVLLFVTGVMLKFFYVPTPEKAYGSVLNLLNEVRFGGLVRNIHRWSANGLVFIVFLHLLRVFYTGACAAPRQFNWIIGLVLFAAVILSNFTGYLLPWDQIAYWAITISTAMLDYVPAVGTTLREWILGGSEPGPKTLLNFYAIHTAVLPMLLLSFLPFHFWRIRKANGLVIPRSPGEDPSGIGETVNSVPHLVTREVTMALLVIASVLLFSMLVNAPLAEQANPGLSPNPTKAPWYFMGLQELLMHFHPVFAVFVIPLMVMAFLLCVPYISYDEDTSGVWFCSGKGRNTALIAAVLATVLTIAFVMLNELVLKNAAGATPGIIGNGLLPFAVIVFVCAGFYLLNRRVFKATNNEAVQALFTLLMTAFVTLTVIGVWFRGAGMQLTWAG